ncbi:MAG TPA: hypothetical protein VLA89_09275 [Gemmatimonadales bacterium]|nr:hypothetical protein [Gemmatimonadales bacterium]
MASKEKLSRHNVILYAGDFDKLQARYPLQGSAILRALLRRFLRDNVPQDEIEIDIEVEEVK